MGQPWMPLYVSDYLADTAHLDATESGAYLHLIMHYWQHGGLPDDAKSLAQISKTTPHVWKKICNKIQKFFHDGWRHSRIDQELLKARDISEKRRSAAEIRHRKDDANAPANVVHLQTQSHPQSHLPKESLSQSPPATASEKDERLLRMEIVRAFEGRGLQLAPDTGRAATWLAQNYDPKICMAVVREMLARSRVPIKTLKYFDEEIAAAHARKAPPPPPKKTPEETWTLQLNTWRSGKGMWFNAWGPPPDALSCRIPRDFIAKWQAPSPVQTAH